MDGSPWVVQGKDSPIHCATYGGHVEVIQALVQHIHSRTTLARMLKEENWVSTTATLSRARPWLSVFITCLRVCLHG